MQKAWIAEQVPQCGYCQSGQIMAAAALLKKTPHPTDGQIDAMHRVVVAVDCGTVVNPDIVRQQAEGATNFGLSAALTGKITIAKGRVEQSNFYDYTVLRMADAPKIEVHVVPSTAKPTGVGELCTPPIAPAIGNAIFRLTGKRVRSLPFSDALA